MAPACSTAFPTIGSRITLMKPTDKPHAFDAVCVPNQQNHYLLEMLKRYERKNLELTSIVATTYSDSRATTAVMRSNQTMALNTPITGNSSDTTTSSSTVSSS